jgi:hypothetical protein
LATGDFTSDREAKTVKPADRALLILEDIRTTHQTQVSKLSFLHQANDVLNAEFHNLTVKERVFVKELFQVDSCAEMFVMFGVEERMEWVFNKLVN